MRSSMISTCYSNNHQGAASCVAQQEWPQPIHIRRRLRTRTARRGCSLVPALENFARRRDPYARPRTAVATSAPTTPGNDSSGSRPTAGSRSASTPPPPPTSAQPVPSQLQAQSPLPSQPQAKRSLPRFRLLPRDPDAPVDRQRPEDNPSLDDIVLDEQYYKEMGLTEEEVLEALRQLDATELDPEGENVGLPHVAALSPASADWPESDRGGSVTKRQQGLAEGRGEEPRGQLPQLPQMTHGSLASAAGDEDSAAGTALQSDDSEARSPVADPDLGGLLSPFSLDSGPEEAEDEVYGPEAVVLAGFRAEEHGLVRALLDSAGGHVVKVLPVTVEMLYGTVDEAVYSAEQDWSAPRPSDGPRGGGWGAQRTVLFSGLGLRAQLTVLELLESSGLAAVCAAVAREELGGRRLGEVLAAAVAAQRGQANRLQREDEPWRAAAAATGRVADARRGLPPLEDLIGRQAQERLRQQAREETDGEATAAAAAPPPPGGSVTGSAGRDAPVLDDFGLQAAQAAATEWEAWSSARAEEASAGWDLEQPETHGSERVRAARASSRGAAEQSAPPDSDLDLTDLGLDLEQLREQVLRQLSELDPETLDGLLVDSPYGDVAGEALGSWREAQAEDDDGGGGGDGPTQAAAASAREPGAAAGVSSSAAATAATPPGSGPGVTAYELQQVAERQRRRWMEAQESMETAAAAAGRFVVQAESSLVQERPGESRPSPPSGAVGQGPGAGQGAVPPPMNTTAASTPAQTPSAGSSAAGSRTTRRSRRTAPATELHTPGSAEAASTTAAAAVAAATAAPPPAGSAAAEGGGTAAATRRRRARGQAVAATSGFRESGTAAPPAAATTTGGGPPPPSPPTQTPPPPPRPPAPLPPPAAAPPPSASQLPLPDIENLWGGGPSFSELDDILTQLGSAGGAASISGDGGGIGGAPGPAVDLLFPAGSPSRVAPGPAAPPAAPSLGESAAAGPMLGGGSNGSLGNFGSGRGIGIGGGGLLQQVQQAASSGADPYEIQRMLDEQLGIASADGTSEGQTEAAPAEDPVEAAAPAGPRRRRGSLFAGLKSTKSKAAQSSEARKAATDAGEAAMTAAPEAPRRRRPYGPAPPPEPDPVMRPLLELRPDIARAVQERKVQFMDLSRLNDKQKRQFVDYQARMRLQQQAEQQQAEQQGLQRGQRGGGPGQEPGRQDQQPGRQATVWPSQEPGATGGRWPPQGQQHQQHQLQEVRGQQRVGGGPVRREEGWQLGAAGETGARGAGGGVADEYVEARGADEEEYGEEGEPEDEQESDQEEEGEDDDDEEEGAEFLDSDKLRQLVEAAQQEGISLEDTLAQAVAMGVRVPEEVLREAGVQPPSAEALARAHEQYATMFQELAAAQGVPMDTGAVTEAAGSGREQEEEEEEDEEEEQEEKELGASNKSSNGNGGSTSTSNNGSSGGSSSRPWGAGLAARRRRPVSSS